MIGRLEYAFSFNGQLIIINGGILALIGIATAKHLTMLLINKLRILALY